MDRLTQTDWRVIVAALAFYGADDLSEEAADRRLGTDEWHAAVDGAMSKAQQRAKLASSGDSERDGAM